MTAQNETKSLLHTLPPGPRPPHEVYCFVEIPRGGSNKYEYDKSGGFFFLDRPLYEAVFYPTEYGFIPQTLEDDGDPCDIMVFSTHPTFPGCVIATRPVGAIRLEDTGEEDNKIIAVPSVDPRFEHIRDLDDLTTHSKKELENFWENYAELQKDKKIKIIGWSEAKRAKELIERGIEKYKAKNPKSKAKLKA